MAQTMSYLLVVVSSRESSEVGRASLKLRLAGLLVMVESKAEFAGEESLMKSRLCLEGAALAKTRAL